MNNIKYFFQFLIIIILFLIFKIIGHRFSNFLAGKIFNLIGPLFRSNKISNQNLINAFPDSNESERKSIIKKMWINYGKIFSEYLFINHIKNSNRIFVENQEILDTIKNNSEPVIFISGHFNNFELMAMFIDAAGINLSTIYRPLNNIFLNETMEKLRIKYICKNQIKKGKTGTRELIKSLRNNFSVALMIDQRVTEGIKCNFFEKEAFTTTIPAQIVKKFDCEIVPVYIERFQDVKFNLTFSKPIKFDKNRSVEDITLNLNNILEDMILKNPSQWILTHDRWK